MSSYVKYIEFVSSRLTQVVLSCKNIDFLQIKDEFTNAIRRFPVQLNGEEKFAWTFFSSCEYTDETEKKLSSKIENLEAEQTKNEKKFQELSSNIEGLVNVNNLLLLKIKGLVSVNNLLLSKTENLEEHNKCLSDRLLDISDRLLDIETPIMSYNNTEPLISF